MKLLFFSDIHGVPGAVEKVLEHAAVLKPDRLVILGDILYHGPRNGVPGFYDPARVAQLLNPYADKIMAVRGNCDSEVDQMMLHFPIMADYAELAVDETLFFLTHGHLWNENKLPPIPEKTILVHGHTHLPESKLVDRDIRIFNPGSISLPKQVMPETFGFYDGEDISVRKLDDGEIYF